MDQVKVELTGPAETMLATLYLRAIDYRLPESVLQDRWAAEAVARLDYDFGKYRRLERSSGSVMIRAKAIDGQVRELLRPETVVLHLGCGLDSRFERIETPPNVDWYDIDQPEVIALRRRLFDEQPNRHAVGASVTDPGLLDAIPADRPVLMIAEGLTMYLLEREGIAMLNRIVDHFPSGDLVFDAFSRIGVAVSNRINPPVVLSRSHLEWGIDDPRRLVAQVPGLQLIAEQTYDQLDLSRIPPPARLGLIVMMRLPLVRRLSRLLHYRFGES